jgi:mRNA-degrading endonuclease HigB of HigAB toxin-antitoxin module/predicted ATPase
MTRILAQRTLREFWEKHPAAEQELKAWYDTVKKSNWQSTHDIKATYGNAIIVDDNRVVFNLKGNDCQLEVKFNFERGWGFIRSISVGRDSEYYRKIENEIIDIHERVYAYLTETVKDGELAFTLRMENRGERLQQGYWFLGNEHYLAFSFWKGNDWRNKTPNIYFAIDREGGCTLEFVSYDDDRKIAFFSEVAEAIGMTQKTRARTGETFEHWYKNYKGNDYIASLETFLKRDKKILDAFIKSSNLQDVFAPIDKEEFDKAKRKIDAERRRLKEDQKFRQDFEDIKSIVLRKLILENISLFGEAQTIEFHRNLTCLIGLNGTGKTSLLRGLVLAFTGYEQNETMGKDDTAILTSQLAKLLHINGVQHDRPTYPASGGFVEVVYNMEAHGDVADSTDYHNKVWLKEENGEPIVRDDSDSDFRNIVDSRYKSLFLAFPQLQGEVKENAKTHDGKYPHISDAMSMLNNQPDNRFGSFADWLRGLNHVANDKQAKGDPQPKERELLRTVFEVISEVTGEAIRLHRIVVAETGKDAIWVVLGQSQSPILFELVSQGYNNVFGWVGYFMKRLVEVTPDGEDFLQTPAIVLIDEIDTYLHPQWQTQILAVLVDKFPNVQFVVTTHSPYVVGSIPDDKIKVYTCHKEGGLVKVELFDDFTPYGANIERLSEKLFGVQGRFVETVRRQFEELSALINAGKLQESKDFLNTHFANIDGQDPDLQRSRMLIRTKEILAAK